MQSAVRLAAGMGADLVFISDGHEAPPLPYSGRRRIAGAEGVGGLVVGAGGVKPSPIPKYDEDGGEVGFYTMGDMVHGSRIGMAPPTASGAKGFHPRNNPYGEDDLRGSEHLCAVHADYLREMAAEAGLSYAPLANDAALAAAIASATRAHPAEARVALDWIFAAIALLALLAAHAPSPVAMAAFFRRLPAKAGIARRPA